MATDTLAYYAQYAVHLSLTCWNCGHRVELDADGIKRLANRGLEEKLFDFQMRCKCTKCGKGCPTARAAWENVRIGPYGNRNPNGSIRDR